MTLSDIHNVILLNFCIYLHPSPISLLRSFDPVTVLSISTHLTTPAAAKPFDFSGLCSCSRICTQIGEFKTRSLRWEAATKNLSFYV